MTSVGYNYLFSLLSFLAFVFFFNVDVPIANSYGKVSLKEVSGVAIFVENQSSFLAKDQIRTEFHEEKIEKRLEDSRIKVYEKSQWINNVGGAFIKFTVVSSKFSKSNTYAFYINAELFLPVVLISKSLGENKSINAGVWSTGKLFSCNEENLSDCVQKGLDDLVDIFINEYKSVNGIS